MSESFHTYRAIAELEVAQAILRKDGVSDSRIDNALESLKARESERLVSRGMDARYWPETEVAGFRRDAKRAARRAAKAEAEAA